MNTYLISDEKLIKQYLIGDESSIEKLILRHKKKIFVYIFLIVKDKQLADDIFQDTFIKVINTLKTGSYNEEGKFVPWVMRIAHNLTIDYFRKSKRIPTIENRDEYDIFNTIKIYDEPVEDKMIIKQIHNDVKELVQLLPEEQKKVLIMRHYADMSFKEIAEQTDVSINTALGRMRYALINLRKLISEKNISLSV
jgi:RNA polymerase sigma-70 factor (ECF subfamily)